jgi:hypothetical protein
MKTKYLRHLIYATCIIACQQATAQNQNFEGFYVQGSIGYENSSPTVDGNVIRSTAGTPSAGTYYPKVSVSSKTFAEYAIGMGYGFKVGEKIILTLGLNINPQDQDYGATVSLSGYTFSPQTGTIKNRRQFFIAPGYEIDNKSLVYGKVGVTSASFENSPDSINLNGTTYGVGYKTFFDKKMYYFLEINASVLNKSSTTGSGTSYTGTYTYDTSSTATNYLVGIGYKF